MGGWLDQWVSGWVNGWFAETPHLWVVGWISGLVDGSMGGTRSIDGTGSNH